ncbi:response regulator [Dehalogenimonas etheniformans]|uniref:response regulator n=1 Tax=Dehalogenimonas etheniformans TaxID=1536648 RepID=UPI00167F2A04|nr:response regulator [Dehalogenimonas etheniformans]QNT75729.1 response regulator [Dehalogenimonas etheniformans]
MKVFLLEDNPGDVRLIKEYFKDVPGITLEGAAELLEKAIGFLKNHEVDVALIDLNVPDSTGLETLKALRAKFPALPIVVLTSISDEDLGSRAIHFGAQDYLVKGQADSGLLRRVLFYAVERKKSEEAINAAAREWQSTFDSITDIIILLDRNHRIIRANKAFTNTFKLKHEAAVGRHCYEIVHNSLTAPVFCPHSRTVNTCQAAHEEFFEPNLGIYIEATTLPTLDQSGNCTGSVHIVKDINERKQAEQALQHLNVELENRVKARTSELETAYNELKEQLELRSKAEESLRSLSNRLLKVQEEERRAIAKELHDEVGQNLTVLKLLLDRIARITSDEARPFVREAIEGISKLIGQVRNMSLSLRPGSLDELGLVNSLEALFKQLHSQAGLEVHFDHSEIGVLTPNSRITAYRIIQEALTNIMRHSGTKEAWVNVQRPGKSIEFSVEDKGCGVDVAKLVAVNSTGLSAMKERTGLVGGTFNFESAPGNGTRVSVSIPL